MQPRRHYPQLPRQRVGDATAGMPRRRLQRWRLQPFRSGSVKVLMGHIVVPVALSWSEGGVACADA